MEALFPDMCWRYQDTQSQLLKKLPSWSRDPYSGFDAIVSYVVSPVEFYAQPCFLIAKAHSLIDTMAEYYSTYTESVPADRVLTKCQLQNIGNLSC